jgi:hypothetical protein
LAGIRVVEMAGWWLGPFPPGFATATLGTAWLLSNDASSCNPDLKPWAESLVAHRADLAEDDFAVEAAVALALLRDHGGDGLPESDRRTLQGAAARCSSVLHLPCEGARFERAVAGRCSAPKGPHRKRDAGADAAASDAGLE